MTANNGTLMGRAARALVQWSVDDEGSMRALALVRMLTVMLLWTRWGGVGSLFLPYPDPRGLIIGTLFYAFTIPMLIGWKTRWSTAATAILIGYCVHVLGLQEKQYAQWVHHHTNLLMFMCWWLVLSPTGRALSVDRWLAIRRAEKSGAPIPNERGSLVGMRLIQLQAASLYFWATVDKLNVAFLRGDRMESYFTEFYFGAEIPDVWWVHALSSVSAWITVVLEFALVVAVLWPRAQRWVFPLGILLHIGFYMLLPVMTYSATMMVVYLACIPADKVHAAIDRLLGATFAPTSSATTEQRSFAASVVDDDEERPRSDS